MGNPWAPPEDTQQGGRPPERPAQVPPHAGHPQDPASGPVGAPAGPPALQPPVPPAPQPTPPPDPQAVARATRTSAWTAGALLVSVLLVSAPWPAVVVAPAAAVAALVLAILAVVRAVRARARGPVLVLPVVLVLSALAWVGLSTYPLLYLDATRAYSRCASEALTEQARRACVTQLETDTRERIEELLSRAGAPPRP